MTALRDEQTKEPLQARIQAATDQTMVKRNILVYSNVGNYLHMT